MIEYFCSSTMIGQFIGAVAGVLAVVGVLLNNRRMIQCFYLFIMSNLICALLHFNAGLWTLMARDVVFIGLALEGIWRWSNKPEDLKNRQEGPSA